MKNEMLFDPFERYEFFLSMLLDYGILSGDELIRDVVEDITLEASSNVNRTKTLDSYAKKARNNLKVLFKGFIDDFAKYLEGLGSVESIYSGLTSLYREIDSDTQNLIFNYLLEAEALDLERAIGHKVELLEFTINEMKSVGLLPKTTVLDISGLRKGFFTLARSRESAPVEIKSVIATTFLGRVELKKNQVFFNSELGKRWVAYIVFEKIFNDGHVLTAIREISKNLGILYKHIKEQESKFFNGEMSESGMEAYELDMQQTYEIDFISNISDMVVLFKGQYEKAMERSFKRNVLRNYFENDLFFETYEELENALCFWYVKRELSKPFIERNPIIERLKRVLTHYRSLLPEEREHKGELWRSTPNDEQTLFDIGDRSGRMYYDDINFISKYSRYIEVSSELSDDDLKAFTIQQIANMKKKVEDIKFTIQTEFPNYKGLTDCSPLHFYLKINGHNSYDQALSTSAMKDLLFLSVLSHFSLWQCSDIEIDNELHELYSNRDSDASFEPQIDDQGFPLVNIEEITLNITHYMANRGVTFNFNALRLYNDLRPKKIKVNLNLIKR